MDLIFCCRVGQSGSGLETTVILPAFCWLNSLINSLKTLPRATSGVKLERMVTLTPPPEPVAPELPSAAAVGVVPVAPVLPSAAAVGVVSAAPELPSAAAVGV